ncbi:MAG: SDR family oxidoreductase [Pseudomonadota bacterium]
MPHTILVTGASSGIGKATARYFQEQGWNVIATMRNTDAGQDLAELDNVLVARLDVTDSTSIETAVKAGVERFGGIDALLNNAGYGAFGPLEAFPMESVRRQFDTNVIGLIEVTKAVLPLFRAQQSGTIVNVSSVGGKITMPLGTLYHGTKFAVEGMSEALHYELAPLGIKVKIIQPGAIETDFGGRSFDFNNDESLVEYQATVDRVMTAVGTIMGQASPAREVAEVIWQAVTDGSDQMRYLAAGGAEDFIGERQALDDAAYFDTIKTRFSLQ